jgi:division protein CdvB (Snf7/Vps24/ESCRT-III family)
MRPEAKHYFFSRDFCPEVFTINFDWKFTKPDFNPESMSKSEVKEEINKVLDNVSEEALESILSYLKGLISKPLENQILSNNLNKILSEDKEVLERLAQ